VSREAGVQFWAGHTYGGNPVACAVGEAGAIAAILGAAIADVVA